MGYILFLVAYFLFLPFTIFNALAAILWACVIGYASFTAGEYILNLSEDFKYVGLFTVVVIFLLITYAFKKIEKK